MRVDERLPDHPGWERDLAGQHHVEKRPFGEVLAEPAGANDGPFDVRTLDDELAPLRLLFSAAGQENQAPDPVLRGSLDEGADGVRRGV